MDCTDTNSRGFLPSTVSGDIIDMTGDNDDLDDVFVDNRNNSSSDRSRNPNVSLQARQNNISDLFGRGYVAAKAARRAVSSLRPLNPTPCRTESVSTGSFITEGDDRYRRAKISSSITTRICIMRSFDPVTGSCVSCLGAGHKALETAGGGPVAIAAVDQCFPACLPVPRGGGECLRVIRVEDGSLRDITLALADSTGKAGLKNGTVVCLGSASHLANVGTAQYIQDWVKSRWWIRERFGEGTVVVPLPPVPVGGLQGRSLVRALVETSNWFRSLDSTECILVKNVHQLFLETFLAPGTGEEWANGRQCFRLPVSLDSHVYTNTVSEGWGSRPDGIPPLLQAAEECLLAPLLKTLNSAFGIELCLHPCTDRDMDTVKGRMGADLDDAHHLVLGGSHAGKLATALGEGGASVDRITSGGWKITADNVRSMLERIAATQTKPDVVIIQVLDNSAYFAMSEEGTLSLPTVLDDGRYHVRGELRLANKEQTLALLKLITPIFRAVPGARMLLVTCLPRYTAAPCCGDASHWDGRSKAERTRLTTELTAMKRTIRSYLFTEKLKVTLVDPIPVCGALEESAFTDSVHLTVESYGALAKHILDLGAESDWPNLPTEEPTAKKARLSSRGGWQRGRGGSGRGNGRGNRGGRGGRGGFFSSYL